MRPITCFSKNGPEFSAEAQAEAFRDTWEWGETAAEAYEDVMRFIGGCRPCNEGAPIMDRTECNVRAQRAMMAARLNELRDVLKSSGSLYLHCDPKARSLP